MKAPKTDPSQGSQKDVPKDSVVRQLSRIAAALERLAPARAARGDLTSAEAFVWQAEKALLQPVAKVNHVPLDLLRGLDQQVETLLQNTRRFALGLPANNALLWGARGMGKSSLVKASHAAVSAEEKAAGREPMLLVELHREDLPSLPRLLGLLRESERRVVLFCDDLSFESEDASYKSLKAVLEGGIEGRPENVIFYATSNRRHLLARDMIENERSTAIHASEAVEEKVSLSDRFGLWLGFHNCDQETFFSMITGYCDRYGLKYDQETLEREARAWSVTRGSRSGRVAWQFIQDLAGRQGVRIEV
ncbi:MAG: ATP-binding protein [Pseudomonadota bacterium]